MEDKAKGATTMNSRATEQLFSTPELAEAIFMELPAVQILLNLQRVCRQWQAVIEGSTPIQQALFFKAVRSNNSQPIRHPAQRRHCLEDYDDYVLSTWNAKKYICLHSAFIPLLEHQSGGRPRPRSYDEPSASWRHSLFSQPGFASLEVDTLRGRQSIKAPLTGLVLGKVMEDLCCIMAYPDSSAILPPSISWRYKVSAWKATSAKELLRRIKGAVGV